MKWWKQSERQHEESRRFLLERLYKMKKATIPHGDDEESEQRERRQRRIEELIQKLLAEEQGDCEAEVEMLWKEHERLTEEPSVYRAQWEQERAESEKIMEQALAFVQSTSFYPPQYVFDLNHLTGLIHDAEERFAKNQPSLTDWRDVKRKAEALREQIDLFQTIHQETAQWIEEMEKKAGTPAEALPLLEGKNELYVLLQKGSLEEATRLLKTLKNRTEK